MFDVKKHLIRVQGGRQYLPVAARLIWFREDHRDWTIETKALQINIDQQYAMFLAVVKNEAGVVIGTGTKMETVRGFGDWLEKAETGAIGRALAVCGYGTQFAPDLIDSDDRNAGDQRQYRDKAPAEVTDPRTGEIISTDSCAHCKRPITPNQLGISLRKFNLPLCPDCQKVPVRS